MCVQRLLIVLIHFFLFIGQLDSETTELMALPRCGVKDKVGFGENRSKRYALQGLLMKMYDIYESYIITFHNLL